ncbi:MAG: trypsin-like serine protease, partial [Myxococcaceae bacterium]|nr:trypsin-like serine protease [Myxococcaceae bacterium]
MRTSIIALTFAVSACGPTVGETPSHLSEQAIIGGTVNPNDPEVFSLIIQAPNGMGAGCTATLIDRRTLLTAAHCVDPRTIMATSVQIFAHNKPSNGQAGFSDFFRLVETRMHPEWNGQGGDDIAMALLDRAPNIAPKPWNQASLAG